VKVGDVRIDPVVDGLILSPLPASKAFPAPESDAWREQHMFRPDGMVESTLGGFLVDTGERVVLVDAGAGRGVEGGYQPPVVDVDDDDDPFVEMVMAAGRPRKDVLSLAAAFRQTRMVCGQLPASLDALGVAREEVTDIVCTHLHFDHIGWLSDEGVPYFPNATVHCAEADLAYFLPGAEEEHFVALLYRTPMAPERLAPVLDRVETWDSDTTIAPGIDVRLAPGHTPGSSVVVVSDGVERAMLLGDMIHCPLELMDDDFNLLVDHDQQLADRVREAYARELEGGDIPVAAAHFPGLRFGRLLPGRGVRHWVFEGA
jgi:glyoxylase-like metal-dependent hydrolase (beta-lactamase superfamily II)